ncbi:MAG: UxaA family hydrolase [Thermaerobacter sp.]|nr:UxaA family hydrolase [Thermaerobacter sp.]
METLFRGFRRANGLVGSRDYRLALPSVVCANWAAVKAAELSPGAIAVEHPLGCAQIGSDYEQTLRVLCGIAVHPNVNTAVVIGLGCEGVPARRIQQAAAERGRIVACQLIQEQGGAEPAASLAATALNAACKSTREPFGLADLVLGVGDIARLGPMGRAVLVEFSARGGRVLQAGEDPGGSARMPYGEPLPSWRTRGWMRAGAGDSETVNGLVASGAQIVLAQADARHLGGHPICPVVRIGYDERLRAALSDDCDGYLAERTVAGWVDYVVAAASGSPVVSEVTGSALFAIARTGPTL